jgi:hypothetical protein
MSADTTATFDCLRWKRADWDPVRWPRRDWLATPPPRGTWVPADMPCEWPRVQRPLLRWALRRPLLPPWPIPSPWPGGMGVVAVV